MRRLTILFVLAAISISVEAKEDGLLSLCLGHDGGFKKFATLGECIEYLSSNYGKTVVKGEENLQTLDPDKLRNIIEGASDWELGENYQARFRRAPQDDEDADEGSGDDDDGSGDDEDGSGDSEEGSGSDEVTERGKGIFKGKFKGKGKDHWKGKGKDAKDRISGRIKGEGKDGKKGKGKEWKGKGKGWKGRGKGLKGKGKGKDPELEGTDDPLY